MTTFNKLLLLGGIFAVVVVVILKNRKKVFQAPASKIKVGDLLKNKNDGDIYIARKDQINKDYIDLIRASDSFSYWQSFCGNYELTGERFVPKDKNGEPLAVGDTVEYYNRTDDEVIITKIKKMKISKIIKETEVANRKLEDRVTWEIYMDDNNDHEFWTAPDSLKKNFDVSTELMWGSSTPIKAGDFLKHANGEMYIASEDQRTIRKEFVDLIRLRDSTVWELKKDKLKHTGERLDAKDKNGEVLNVGDTVEIYASITAVIEKISVREIEKDNRKLERKLEERVKWSIEFDGKWLWAESVKKRIENVSTELMWSSQKIQAGTQLVPKGGHNIWVAMTVAGPFIKALELASGEERLVSTKNFDIASKYPFVAKDKKGNTLEVGDVVEYISTDKPDFHSSSRIKKLTIKGIHQSSATIEEQLSWGVELEDGSMTVSGDVEKVSDVSTELVWSGTPDKTTINDLMHRIIPLLPEELRTKYKVEYEGPFTISEFHGKGTGFMVGSDNGNYQYSAIAKIEDYVFGKDRNKIMADFNLTSIYTNATTYASKGSEKSVVKYWQYIEQRLLEMQSVSTELIWSATTVARNIILRDIQKGLIEGKLLYFEDDNPFQPRSEPADPEYSPIKLLGSNEQWPGKHGAFNGICR